MYPRARLTITTHMPAGGLPDILKLIASAMAKLGLVEELMKA